MKQVPMIYPPVYTQPASYSCNGVKIDIHNPQANNGYPMPMPAQPPVQPVFYNYPQGSVYAQNPISYPMPPYVATQKPAQQQAVQQQVVPQKPVVVDDVQSKITPTIQQTATIVPPPPKMQVAPTQVINNNVAAPVAAPKNTMQSVDAKAVANTVKAEDKPQDTACQQTKVQEKPQVNIKPSEDLSAKLRGDFVAKLQSPDADVQSKALIEIANTTQQLAEMKKAVFAQKKEQPEAKETKELGAQYQKAFDSVAGVVLDEKVVESILSILVKDSSSLEGPTPKQIELRTKEMQGKTLNDSEKTEADKLSPMEKAEQNKEFALFTLRLVQEMYMDGIEQMTGSQPALKDVPGVEQMVVTVKSNPNPAIRAAAISALSHNSREQDKNALNTIFKIASEQDEDENVRQVASQSLAKISGQTKKA